MGMKSEWTAYTLGEITDLVIDHRGKTPKKLGGDWSSDCTHYRALSAKNIKTGQIVNPETIRYVSPDMYSTWMKEQVQKGDIFITSEAPFGQILYWDSDEKIVLSQRIFGIRLKKEVCSRYVYYYMLGTSFQAELDARATGTTVFGLRQPELLKCTVRLPSLPTQRKIAAILSSLDDKIENNNAICKNLEEQAAALYKSWFVDFEPYKGRRPEDWKVVKLSEAAAKISDGVHNTIVDVADSYYYLLSCKNIVGGQLKITGNERRIGKRDFMRLRKRTQLSQGDILLSSVGTVGELVLLREEPENFEFQRSVAIIKANSDLVSPDYLFWTLRNMQAAIRAAAHGAVQQCLFLGDIANFDILLPTKEAVNKFNLLVAGQGNRIALLEDENKRLASLRDTLLPKLMSGEIDVDNCLI